MISHSLKRDIRQFALYYRPIENFMVPEPHYNIQVRISEDAPWQSYGYACKLDYANALMQDALSCTFGPSKQRMKAEGQCVTLAGLKIPSPYSDARILLEIAHAEQPRALRATHLPGWKLSLADAEAFLDAL